MRVSCSAIRFLWYWLKIVHVPNNIGWSEVMFRPFRCILPEARPLRQTLLGMLTHWLVGAWRGNINWWTQRRWEQISQSTPQAWLKCSVSEDLHPLLYCRHWTAHITLFCPYQFIVYFVDIAFNHQKKKEATGAFSPSRAPGCNFVLKSGAKMKKAYNKHQHMWL